MFFRYLVLEGVLKESVADLVNSPKLCAALAESAQSGNDDKLLSAPSFDDRTPLRDRALLALLYATGCRASEVCGLTLRGCESRRGWCRCLGKGSKERIVSLNPVARTAVEKLSRPGSPAAAGTDPIRRFSSRVGPQRSIGFSLETRQAICGRSRRASKEVSRIRFGIVLHPHAGRRGGNPRAAGTNGPRQHPARRRFIRSWIHSRLKAIHERCHPRG